MGLNVDRIYGVREIWSWEEVRQVTRRQEVLRGAGRKYRYGSVAVEYDLCILFWEYIHK